MADEKMELNPVGNICNPKPDPHVQLLEAWQSRDLNTFKSILQDPEVSPDHWFDDPYLGTCLYLVAKEDHGAEFATALIKSGAQTNLYNKSRKKYPIHIAAEHAQDEVLQILLSSPGIDVNALDSYGDTPLHVIAKKKLKADSQDLVNRYKHCIQLLMNQDGINPNITNKKGYTAVQWAAQFGSKEILQTILEHAGDDLDVDSSKTLVKTRTAREFILDRYPELAELLPETQENRRKIVDVNNLFQHLYRKEEELFISTLKSFPEKESLEKSNGSLTLLQYAADHGLFWATKALVQKGAKCHGTCDNEQRSPALLACYGGYADVLGLLVSKEVDLLDLRAPKGEGTALHVLFNNPQVYRPSEERNYKECLDILLKDLQKFKLDINATDIKGNTALHYAAKNGDEYAVNALLKHGAYIGVKNVFGDSPLVHMSPEMLETFLNDCLSTNEKFPREDFYELTFSYKFLVPPQNKTQDQERRNSYVALMIPPQNNCEGEDHQISDHVPKLTPLTTNTETEPLLYISKSRDLKHLLKHPIFTSFLHLKWHRIRIFFYINLVFYLIFVALLTLHILYNYDNPLTPDPTASPGKNDSVATPAETKIPVTDNSSVFWWAVLVIFLILLLLREIFQLIVSLKVYLKSPENYLEILLLLATGAILFCNWVHDNAKAHFSAIGILLSWAELVLLIGRHPRLSTNIEMFKTVSWNFLKFLAWYAILIFAFALSFYTLFRDCGGAIECGEEGDSEENLFLSPGNSIFKTVVMLTGEFEATSIPFVSFPFTSHIVFVLFIFLIAIVLFNLLNGLAVSDTQAIRDDAEVVSYISRVKLMSYIESMFQGSPVPFSESLKRLCCCWPAGNYSLNSITDRVRLFPNKVPSNQIWVFPNLGGKILFTDGERKLEELEAPPEGCCPRGCSGCTLDPEIVKKAMDILSSRGKISEMEELKQMMEDLRKEMKEKHEKFDEFERSQRETKQMVEKILAMIAKTGSGNKSDYLK